MIKVVARVVMKVDLMAELMVVMSVEKLVHQYIMCSAYKLCMFD